MLDCCSDLDTPPRCRRRLQLFLQVFEYGVLSDSDGMEVNFRNTIIVMTSNIGAHKFDKLNTVGFGQTNNVSEGVLDELKKAYSPEFINRIDETIVFDRLNESELLCVCELLLKRLKKNIRTNNGAIMMFDKPVAEYITSKMKDDTYGARPLRRLITEHLETPIAELIIESETDVRKVSITVTDGELKFDITYSA